jgi:hypothetical protein
VRRFAKTTDPSSSIRPKKTDRSKNVQFI